MSSLLIGVSIVGAVYAVLCALLYIKQEQLLFYPVVTDQRLAKSLEPHHIVIEASDVAIEGWWLRNESVRNECVILYFGGNAEDVAYSVAMAEQFRAKQFLATNYRGYGKTGGKPTGEHLFKDALAVYDYAVSRPGISAQNIVVMGRSLGSGVATYLASQRPVRAVILVTPYDSIAAVAQGHYPYFPVSWLLKHRFPSADFASEVRVPALMIAAEFDEVIPTKHTSRLMDAWSGPKRLVTIAGAGHNDLDQANEYLTSVNSFLDSLR